MCSYECHELLCSARFVMICETAGERQNTKRLTNMWQHLLCCAAAVCPCAHALAPDVFRHYDESHPISYGVQLPMGRAPFAFATAESKELAQYVLRDESGPFDADLGDSSTLQQMWGFEEDSINEQGDSILKADWYADSFWGAPTTSVFVPRTDDFLPARPAPLRVQALVDAFRHASSACWARLATALHQLESQAAEDHDLRDCLHVIRQSIQTQGHFTGVEAQIWKGGDLTMDSHTDGGTALLHLGVTVGGARTLRVGKFPERHSPYRAQESRRRGIRSGDEISVWNEQAYHKRELWDILQSRGCFYLSSPFCFEHGVKYQKQSSGPTLALQHLGGHKLLLVRARWG